MRSKNMDARITLLSSAYPIKTAPSTRVIAIVRRKMGYQNEKTEH